MRPLHLLAGLLLAGPAALGGAVGAAAPAAGAAAGPSAPRQVAVTAGYRSGRVTFRAPVRAGADPVLAYRAVAAPGGRSCRTGPRSTGCTIGGLVNGRSYQVRVAAVTRRGEGTWSGWVRVLPHARPRPPAGLAVRPADGYAVATWSNTLEPGTPLLRSEVVAERDDLAGTVRCTAPGTGRTCLLQHLVNDRTYRVKVRTVGIDGPAGTTAWSPPTTVRTGSSGSLLFAGASTYGENGQGVGGPASPADRPGRVTGSEDGWATVATGDEEHSCAIRPGSTLWCWGANTFGQLGSGDLSDRPAPQQVGAGHGWSAVATGMSSTCAVQDGSLLCWGNNADGELGTGDLVDRHAPAAVGGDTDWATLAAGWHHGCGLRTDGSLWCWGGNEHGQLGLGDLGPRTTPAEVSPGATWRSVSAAAHRTCGIRSDGSLWCWGENVQGGLGTGDTDDRTAPTLVGSGWSQVSVGVRHVCGLQETGTLWCWGGDGDGQLGVLPAAERHAPGQVGTWTDWTDVAAGGSASCGVRVDGSLWCWGSGRNGMLGNGAESAPTPVRIAPDDAWAEVDAGGESVCALADSGELSCWGEEARGLLGRAVVLDSPTRIVPATGWSRLSAGAGTVCGVTVAADLWCWGRNDHGQLGLGDRVSRAVPVPVDPPGRWADVSTGGGTTCGRQIDGSLWCWGRGDDGRLLTPDGTDRVTPRWMLQPFQDGWGQVQVTGAMACASGATPPEIWLCWGDHSAQGQMDMDGATVTSSDSLQCRRWPDGRAECVGFSPYIGYDLSSTLLDGGPWAELSPADDYVCGVHLDGTLHCSDGAPAGMPAGAGWAHVAAGPGHACATRTDGPVWCWGDNSSGQLGLGDTVSRTTAEQVPGVTGRVVISGSATYFLG